MVFSFLSSGQSHGECDQRNGKREQCTRQHPLNQAVELLITWGGRVVHQCTMVFICKMGIRIEKATKAITAPMSTIIIGSSKAVSAPMRTLTLDS